MAMSTFVVSRFVIQKKDDTTSAAVANVRIHRFHSTQDLNLLKCSLMYEMASTKQLKKTQTGANMYSHISHAIHTIMSAEKIFIFLKLKAMFDRAESIL